MVSQVLTKIEKTEFEFVIATNWDLFFAKSGKRYFLLTGKTWLMAQELAGPWTSTQQLPKDMTKLPANENLTTRSRRFHLRPEALRLASSSANLRPS
jgi:hypothetical protein